MKKSAPPKPAPKSAAEIAKRDAAALARVAVMDDPDGLRNLMANAKRMGVEPVRTAAFRRLAAVQSEGAEGSVENATWQMVHAVEQIRREAAGKAVPLTQLRREIAKVGAGTAIGRLVVKPGPSERFDELIGRGEPSLTAEAIVLAHPDDFDAETRAAATARLEAAGMDPAAMAP